MRILVYPHDLGIGGSQLNAIELAGRLKQSGHEVVVFGQTGPLTARVAALDLEFVAAPTPRRRPSPAVVSALTQIIDERRIEVVHGYEWPPILEAWLATRGRESSVAVGTVMSMAVAPFIPGFLPLFVGTEQIAAEERRRGRRGVQVMEPPVDLEHNACSEEEVVAFRGRWGLEREDLTLVTVTRLATELKLEGLLTAIDGVGRLTTALPQVRLVVVGDGPARRQVELRAAAVNDAADREVVVLTGELDDPRTAYAAGDIHLAMGGSALRALAFSKPLIVQGEQGFYRLLDPGSVDDFLWTGWYGIGRGSEHGPASFATEIAKVVDSVERRSELGRFGRSLVEERFGLAQATSQLADFYRQSLTDQTSPATVKIDVLRAGISFARYSVDRRVGRVLRRSRTDDFNARPVVSTGPARPRTSLNDRHPGPSGRRGAVGAGSPRVGVAVVTYNSQDRIERLLDSLPAALDGVPAQVVVVDNDSTDGTADVVAARTDCTLVRSDNRGYGAGMNRAHQALRDTDALLILNPDLTLDPGAVRVMLDRLEDPSRRTGIVVPRLSNEDGELAYSLRREPTLANAVRLDALRHPVFREVVTDRKRYEQVGVVDWATGAAMLISMACFDELGGFDESFFLYSEETDLCLRARDHGWSTVFTPGARAHHVGAGSGATIRLHGAQLRSRVRLYRKRHSATTSVLYGLLVALVEVSWILRRKSESTEALRMLVDRRDTAAVRAV